MRKNKIKMMSEDCFMQSFFLCASWDTLREEVNMRIHRKKTNILLWKTFLVEKNLTFCIIV